ncbi:sulfite reductase, partial [Planococcus sp. SIMBA_143]
AGFVGDRLSKLYKENIGEEEILASLKPILFNYAKDKEENEHFGDYVIRAGYVEEVRSGLDFHS